MSLGDGGGFQGPKGEGSFPNQATFSGCVRFPGSTCPLGIFLRTGKFQAQSGKRLFLAGLPIHLPVGVVPPVVRWTDVQWGRNVHPGVFLLLCVGWDMPGLGDLHLLEGAFAVPSGLEPQTCFPSSSHIS